MTERWRVDHVEAMASDHAAVRAARALAVPHRWRATGADGEAVWGECRGTSAEPYQVAVELGVPAFRCSCPSRRVPCKHALALLLLWAHGHVATSARAPFAATWLAGRAAKAAAAEAASARRTGDPTDVSTPGDAPQRSSPTTASTDGERRAVERARRAAAGLAELDRWILDRVRTGLTDPTLATYAAWDEVAARLVDAQTGGLANRVRRLAGAVGTAAGWHEHVLAELGMLHALCCAGARLAALPDALADGVRATVGWQVRQADVLASTPVTDRWHVAGRGDTLEDRIVVRRTWLRGARSGRWVLLLSFAAYGQSLGGEPEPGTCFDADVHLYPGALALRGVLGEMRGPAVDDIDGPPSVGVAGACAELGAAYATEPWLERHPVTVAAAPSLHEGLWVLTDGSGSLPLARTATDLAMLLACSGGSAVPVTAEWTAAGLVPLTVHGASGAVDVGPRGGWS